LESATGTPLEVAEREALQRALEGVGGNRKRAAESLGVSYVTLWRKMKKLHLLN
jgi:transcriptional regulator with PAS, ATPase and Fis domain